MSSYQISNINISDLSTNEVVVTDGFKNLVSMPYSSSTTNSSIVSRDASGNFSANTITANLNGNASTVTTNANLTGPITSTGNVTGIGSQTGTGSTFVMDTSPTLITPNIGVASGTSLNLSSLAASQTVVTDSLKNLISMQFTPNSIQSTIMSRDVTGNSNINNLISGYTSTITSGGTTTLTSSSTYQQYFTGSLNQTIVLPNVSTLSLGQSFLIVNNSTGTLTVNSSGNNTIGNIQQSSSAILTCIQITGTSSSSWNISLANTNNFVPAYYNAYFNENISTTSTNLTPVSKLSISPTVSGTYYVISDLNIFTNNYVKCSCAIYSNGVTIPSSIRSLTNYYSSFSFVSQCFVSWTAGSSKPIQTYWSVSSGTLYGYSGGISAIQIG